MSLRRVIAPLVLLLASQSSAAPSVLIAGGSFGVMWRVKGKGGVAHVLARIHVMDRSVYPVEARLKRAFEHSQVLAIEMNLSDPARTKDAQRLYHEAGSYPRRDSLDAHVSAETYRAVQEALHSLGVDPKELDHAQPWLAAEVLRETVLRKADFDPKLILELPFVKMAQGKMDVTELLPIEEQLPVLAAFPEPLLKAVAVSVPSLAEQLNRVQEAWKEGDRALYTAVLAEARHPEGAQLTTQLAKIAVDHLSELLSSGKTAFVILDGDLLLTNGGVFDQLRALGFAVEAE